MDNYVITPEDVFYASFRDEEGCVSHYYYDLLSSIKSAMIELVKGSGPNTVLIYDNALPAVLHFLEQHGFSLKYEKNASFDSSCGIYNLTQK